MKRLIFLATVIVCLIIINGLLHSIYDLWNKQDLIKDAKTKLAEERAENTKLKAKLKEVNSPEFIEEEARNKLFLVKPGESPVILPDLSPTHKKYISEASLLQEQLAETSSERSPMIESEVAFKLKITPEASSLINPPIIDCTSISVFSGLILYLLPPVAEIRILISS